MKLDFHCHTHYSIDSIINPKELAAKSRKLGIIPAITDHNTISAHQIFRELGADFIPGEEIRTDRGDLIGLYLSEAVPRMTPFDEAIDQIREQGGLTYLPHMFDTSRKGVNLAKSEAKKIDIVEVFNARCLKQEFNQMAKTFNTSAKCIPACGSDSHFLFEFGHNYNNVPDFDLEDPKALLKALKSKDAKQTTKHAPFYVRGTTTLLALGRKMLKLVPHH